MGSTPDVSNELTFDSSLTYILHIYQGNVRLGSKVGSSNFMVPRACTLTRDSN